ncbi:MAG: hypothetical protein Q9222_006895 [Ikaeria aurantiellina]
MRPIQSTNLSPSMLLLLPLVTLTLAASNTGDISLWTDSSCHPGATPSFSLPDPIALNFTVTVDTCTPLKQTAHSYIVNSRPICASGSPATWNYYGGKDCKEDGIGPAITSTGNAGTDFDGLCLALVAFNSVAFVCEGIGEGSEGSPSSSSVSTSSAIASTATATATATPIAPSPTTTAATGPPYTLPLESTLATGGPTGTQPGSSGVAFPTGGALPPSPSPFTGAAADGVKVSLIGAVFAVLGNLIV